EAQGHKRLARALLCALALAASGAHAERWYQVELLIFRQANSASSERFPANPTLSYPTSGRFLLDDARILANEQRYPDRPSRVDELGQQHIGLTTDIPSTDAIADANVEAQTIDVPPGDDTEGVIEPPRPFVLLPNADQEFRGKAAYMRSRGGYQILFHETWLQPVTNKANAIPIIIDRSGDGGQWPELQGSITLYVSRFLHIETNLWLNTPGQYFDSSWRMAPAPLGPPSLVVAVDPEAAASVTALPTAAELDPNEPTMEEDPAAAYPYRHAVALQQKRRMRSREVHYIDHPLLGVICKLTPIDFESPEDTVEPGPL
ncbi:MAG: CsiV family protein, partial [Pseudomonadota bacterium]